MLATRPRLSAQFQSAPPGDGLACALMTWAMLPAIHVTLSLLVALEVNRAWLAHAAHREDGR